MFAEPEMWGGGGRKTMFVGQGKRSKGEEIKGEIVRQTREEEWR